MHQHGSNPMGIEMMIPVMVIVIHTDIKLIIMKVFTGATKGVVKRKNSTAFMLSMGAMVDCQNLVHIIITIIITII